MEWTLDGVARKDFDDDVDWGFICRQVGGTLYLGDGSIATIDEKFNAKRTGETWYTKEGGR